ncbi:hypothetical protein F4821DRAFT_280614 [Hypoxylon rubiginosum]|uniref:Uncharacterized protein n=1 Tax=Hypoxylon rubiginosum TaxID=110542 RepID=A0ACC0CTX3_9PEZI|nr:hypothetical protein F4821DRAFT_280614 [Hypoxylon rubiginosum]
MRFAPILIGVSLVQAAFSAVAAIPDGKRAVSFGDSGISLRSTWNSFARRGEEYSLDQLDDLEEESEKASKDQVYKGIDYLVNIFNKQGVKYGLMGGVALQLYGYDDRETKDSDMVVSVNSRDLLNKIKDDPNISRPSALMAASGTARLFIKIGDQQVASDVFVQGGDQSPALETHKSGNYNVLNLGPLITSKLRRSEDKDKDDILWLAQNKTDDVKAVADSIDKKKRIELAKEYDDDEQEDILKAFKLSKDDIDD